MKKTKKTHKRMMDGGMATMDMPTRGNRPVGAGIAKRPPRGPFILPQYPNTIGTGNGPDYQSGYSEGMKPGRGGNSSGYDRGGREHLSHTMIMKKGGAVKSSKMRGGGLARKGVGMALAKGGLAKRAGGCAKRGVGRGKVV